MMENARTAEELHAHGSNLENKKKIMRNSSIELIKIIAIIFIVLSHSMPNGDINKHSSAIDINLGTNFQMSSIQLMHNLGEIGNAIFLICACWFLLDSKKTNGEKIATLIGDAFFVSVVSLIIFSIMGYKFPLNYLYKQFIPVMSGNSWFLSVYILLYAIHPLLNMIIEMLDKKRLCSISVCLFIMYSCIYLVLANRGFYYSRIIGFVTIYFITAFVKKSGLYKKLEKKKISISLILLCFILQVGINLLLSHIAKITGKGLYSRLNDFKNPLILLIAFASLGLSLRKNFTNKIINYISSLSLLIYITHCNRIIRDYVRFDFFQYILENYSYNYLLVGCFVSFGIALVYGVTFAILYKSIFKKFMDKISVAIYKKVNIIWNKIIDFIVKNENESENNEIIKSI